MSGKAIAIITARGGSKRIPKKNIRNFCGKPIIAYSIEAALDSRIFSEVMVSPDSEEIAGIAREYGASVPFLRSGAASGDYATTADVLKEVLTGYGKLGKYYENACCIYPTAPFVTAEKLKKAMDLLEEEQPDCVMPVTAFSFPPLRGMVLKEGKLSYKWKEYALARSQDLETIYHDCGQFYAFRVERFLKTGRLVTENTGGIIMPELEVQDIDNETDWKLAELKYQLCQEKGEN